MTLKNMPNHSVYPLDHIFFKLKRLVGITIWVFRFAKALMNIRVESNRKYNIKIMLMRLISFKNLK